MYKLLLSWRYLRTRYIALASVISVTLGVATLIVVNSVMAGFTSEMHKRLHGILSDIVFESHSLGGFQDPDWHIGEIERLLGEDIEGITAVVHVPAMLNFQVRGQWITRQVNLIGIDDQTYGQTSDFGKYLLHPKNREQISFDLREDGYAPEKEGFPESGWEHRRAYQAWQEELNRISRDTEPVAGPTLGTDPHTTPAADTIAGPTIAPVAGPAVGDPNALPEHLHPETDEPLAKDQHYTGLILGIAIGTVRHRNPDTDKIEDHYLIRPGDDVKLTFPTSGQPPKAVSDNFTVVDLYESKMSEYDGTFAFMPLSQLQEMRGMVDPLSGLRSVTSIQIKLKDGVDITKARDKLRSRFPIDQFAYRIQTWKDMQGPLLAAVQMETTILNILLFLIIAVAGFGILATFFMIVVEKTRDIGILKSLGAPSRGVMGIFLSYGFSLGTVGSGVGMVLGLLFVAYINEIAAVLEAISGREVFDPTVYYFQEIPAIVHPITVVWVVIGSVLIAVMASVLPALRAAMLHPVEALRYE